MTVAERWVLLLTTLIDLMLIEIKTGKVMVKLVPIVLLILGQEEMIILHSVSTTDKEKGSCCFDLDTESDSGTDVVLNDFADGNTDNGLDVDSDLDVGCDNDNVSELFRDNGANSDTDKDAVDTDADFTTNFAAGFVTNSDTDEDVCSDTGADRDADYDSDTGGGRVGDRQIRCSR